MRLEERMEGRLFIAARPGEKDREIEFLAHGQIGKGRDFDRETWHVVEPEPGRFALRIMDRHRMRYELQRRDDDHWLEAGAAHEAMSLAALSSPIDPALGRRHSPFVRALCEAVFEDNRWTPEAEAELRIVLKTLCKLDPPLADEVADHASGARELDGAVRESLLRLAAEHMRLTDQVAQRRELRPHSEILFDQRHYVRP